MGGPLTNVNIGQLIKDFGSNLWSELTTVLSAIGTFLSSFFNVWSVGIDDFEAIVTDIEQITANVKAEVQKIKAFSIQPNLRTRVIHVPTAVEAIHDFVEAIRDKLFEDVQNIIDPVKELISMWNTEKQTLATSMDKPNGLVRASSFLHSVESTIHQIRVACDAAKDVTELANELTDQLQNLNLLFLQQGNPRVRLKGTISARVGKIHASA